MVGVYYALVYDRIRILPVDDLMGNFLDFYVLVIQGCRDIM